MAVRQKNRLRKYGDLKIFSHDMSGELEQDLPDDNHGVLSLELINDDMCLLVVRMYR